MRELLKKSFPILYDYYLHVKRKKQIEKINQLKRLPKDKYPEELSKIYEQFIGHKLDWNNLNDYTEKMQYVKLYDDSSLKVQLSDKYTVREWVEEKIGSEYLIPMLGVWEKFEDIDFSKLPDRFVMKTNHGSGTNIITKDKNKLNYKQLKRTFTDWLNTDYGFHTGFELHYSHIKPMIIAEKYIESDHGQLQDYKFLCFGGKVYYCWVDMDRYVNHTRTVFDLDWNMQEWNQASYGVYKEQIPKPKNFDKMVELAEILCQGFHHVRVDLYNVDGKIYFGEMTFTNGSGLDPIVPQKYDRMLGDLWDISDICQKKNDK